MRILILNWRDIKNPRAGGAERVTHEHAKAWIKAGHEVIQFSASFKGALPEETIDGVKIIRRGRYFTVHFWALVYFLLGRFGPIDLVIDEFHFTPFLTPLYFRKAKKVALIFEVARDVWFANWPFPLALAGYLVEPWLFRFYRQVPFITDSPSTKKDLIGCGIKEGQITIIYPGISAPFLKRTPAETKEPIVLFVGYLSPDKGIKAAIDAFALIKKEQPRAKFWIVGKGKNRFVRKLEKRAVDLGLSKEVKFWGFVSEDQKWTLMKKACLLIHPSQREGWGMVVIEANAMGTPVVGYDVPGLRDSIQDGETGVLTKKNDPTHLAQEVVRLLKDQKKYHRLRKKAWERSKKFRWARVTKESLQLIERIGGGK